MSEQKKTNLPNEKSLDLTNVISTAIQVPGVKVTRDAFLREQFKDLHKEKIDLIIEKGPIEAGVTRQDLIKKANRIIKERTAFSTGASFIAGIPGGWALAATIPADIIQFYGIALRMAQELIYLYGEPDIWCEGTPDSDKVINQLILYCGVMLGATGAAQTVRVMSSALARQALKKLPQKALTKTIYYPVIKSILKFFGVSLTKSTFAKGVSKVIPVVGGVVSGGITLASMHPMGKRLLNTLDKAHFDYTTTDFESDMRDISCISSRENKKSFPVQKTKNTEALEQIQKAKQMCEDGIITKEEFMEIKSKIISKM